MKDGLVLGNNEGSLDGLILGIKDGREDGSVISTNDVRLDGKALRSNDGLEPDVTEGLSDGEFLRRND